MTINKHHLHAEILRNLDDELTMLLKAAEAAYDGAVHEEAVSKSKYETHGLELSYLAGSHFDRSVKLRHKIRDFKSQAVRPFTNDEAIAVGALITLQSTGLTEYVYLSHAGGGMLITLADKSIQIATPLSPLGQQLIDSYVGDEIEIPSKAAIKSKVIINIA